MFVLFDEANKWKLRIEANLNLTFYEKFWPSSLWLPYLIKSFEKTKLPGLGSMFWFEQLFTSNQDYPSRDVYRVIAFGPGV